MAVGGMAKITLDVSDEVAAQLQEMLKKLEATVRAAQAADGSPLDGDTTLSAITAVTTPVGPT